MLAMVYKMRHCFKLVSKRRIRTCSHNTLVSSSSQGDQKLVNPREAQRDIIIQMFCFVCVCIFGVLAFLIIVSLNKCQDTQQLLPANQSSTMSSGYAPSVIFVACLQVLSSFQVYLHQYNFGCDGGIVLSCTGCDVCTAGRDTMIMVNP